MLPKLSENFKVILKYQKKKPHSRERYTKTIQLFICVNLQSFQSKKKTTEKKLNNCERFKKERNPN